MTRLAALVVTYNRQDQLRQTMAALLSEPPDVLGTVVVVDNASTDGTAEWLAGLGDDRLDIVSLADNQGGAGGFAAGLARVRDHHDPDWTVLMDDDARPDPGCLARFLAVPRAETEAWFGAPYLPDGSIANMNRPWRNPFWHRRVFLKSLLRGRGGFHLGEDDYAKTTPVPVDGGSFVGVFLSREGLRIGGLPDPALFLYGDDVLYTLELSARSGPARFDPQLRFTHDCGTLTGPGPVFEPLWKAYFFHRNQIFVYRRAAGPVLFWPVLALKWLSWRTRAPAYGARRGYYLRVLGAAVRDGILGRTDRSLADAIALSGSKAPGDTSASGSDPG